jgi:hypothetical protein
MWKRHQAGKDFYSFFTDDGKIDIEDNGFIKKYSHKIIPEELEKLKAKKNKKNNVVVKKVVVKKDRVVKPKNEKKDTEPEKPKDEELQKLARKATIAKHKSDIFKADKAELELKKSRAEVAEIQTIGQVCIGYLMALNQTLLDQPRSWIDEISLGIKAGKSKTDLTDMARKPAMEAIAESIEIIKKEIKKYKRDTKSSLNE